MHHKTCELLLGAYLTYLKTKQSSAFILFCHPDCNHYAGAL